MATKKDLIDRVADKIDFLDAEDISYAVDEVVNQLSSSLVQGDRIEIRGFGSLSTRDRKTVGSSDTYKATYYRMSKNVQELLNNISGNKE